MNKNSKQGSESTQGVGLDGPPPSLAEVRKFLQRDLQMCIHLLTAVHDDEGTRNSLADFLLGRFMNAKHKKELEAQQQLGLNDKE